VPNATDNAPAIPIFDETLGGALIDAAGIAIMAALHAFTSAAARVLVAGDEQTPTIADCLQQAMEWIRAARMLTLADASDAPTSLHVLQP